MDIAALSMNMNQTKVQGDVGIALMKMVMNKGEENSVQMTEMMKNSGVDRNRGQHLDVMI